MTSAKRKRCPECKRQFRYTGHRVYCSHSCAMKAEHAARRDRAAMRELGFKRLMRDAVERAGDWNSR